MLEGAGGGLENARAILTTTNANYNCSGSARTRSNVRYWRKSYCVLHKKKFSDPTLQGLRPFREKCNNYVLRKFGALRYSFTLNYCYPYSQNVGISLKYWGSMGPLAVVTKTRNRMEWNGLFRPILFRILPHEAI